MGKDQKNRDAILAQLKQQGAMTAAALAQLLGVTSMGARQHLLRLEQQALVENFSQKAALGRPKQYWQLTARGHGRFPDRHSELTVQLIASVRQHFGENGLDKVISSREHEMEAHYQQQLSGKTNLADKLQQLAQLRSQEGYMAEVTSLANGEFLLIENHCPICSAAQSCQGFCRSELAIFQRCLGADVAVERTEYLLAGDRRCCYRVKAL